MSDIKTLAIYLPQFHETEENNKWWGKGFTEWTAVKDSEPYFENHRQPRVPYKENYYDLMNKETFKYQEELMKKYGIYGFCFYHYYFKDHKKVLEKPAEKLLEWTDIDIPFCFNWASESWVRSWSKIYGNVWGEKCEIADKNSDKEVLLQEYYGDKKDWEKHFEYLLPFFKDKRYIKKDGKPVFIFYNANRISCISKMIECWIDLAIENGFTGMYIIGEHLTAPVNKIDAALIQQPDDVMVYLNSNQKSTINNGVRCYQYSDVVERVSNVDRIIGYDKCYFMGQVGLDDTPRRGKNGTCIVNGSPELFEKMMDRLFERSVNAGNEIIFINAWNEWGEGMYLEPDTDYKFAYLDAISKVILKYKNLEVKQSENNNQSISSEQLSTLIKEKDKYTNLFSSAMKLLNFVQNNCKFSEYLNRMNYSSLAIYGVGILGKSLIYQLESENIKIDYVVDRIAGNIGGKYSVFRPEEDLPEVDLMIITAYGGEEIKQKLQDKNNNRIKKILSLDEILDKIIDYK